MKRHPSTGAVVWPRLRVLLAATTLLAGFAPVADAAAAPRPAEVAAADPQPIRLSAGVVTPGQVTTTVVELPRELSQSGADGVRFHIEPTPGVRLFSKADGEMGAADLADAVLPLTFSVPRQQLAGGVVLARVSFASSSGASWSGELTGTVAPDPRLELTVETAQPEAAPGGVVEVRYALVNLGNSVDSAMVEVDGGSDWVSETAASMLRVAPGQKLGGVLRLRAPASATPGDRLLVHLVARGGASVARADMMVEITFADVAANYSYPLSVFTGASGSAADGVAADFDWAISGSGEVADNTIVSVDARSRPTKGARTAFAGVLSGPAFRVTLQRPDWQVSAGELFQAQDAITGAYLHGTGASGEWRRGSVRLSGSAAESQTPGVFSGRVARGDVAVQTAAGEFGVGLRSDERAFQGVDGATSLRAGAVTYRHGSTGGLRADASAGLARIADDAGASLAPIAHVDLAHSSERGSFSLRARRMPERASAFNARGNELYAGGTLELGGGLAATAWYADDALAARSPLPAGRSTAASAGLRYGSGGFQAVVRGTTLRTNAPGSTGAGTNRSAAAVDLAATSGGFTGSLTAERSLSRGSSLVDYLQGSVQRYGGSGWTSLTGSYSATAGGDPVVRLDLVHSLELGPARVDFAAGASPTQRLRETMSAWTRAEIELGGGTSVFVGGEYTPMGIGGGALQLSLGVSRALSVGLPTRRGAPVAGVAFHDLDGDGVRDEGEPGFAGLTLRRGGASINTNAAGGFELRGSEGGPVTVDAGSLKAGFVVYPGALAGAGRDMQIPVVQVGGLELEFFVDGNGNGVRDDGEEAVAGADVTLTHSSGVRYGETADAAGRIVFRALTPGAYVARVAGSGLVSGEVDVHVASGTASTKSIPLRRVEREIRFGAAAPHD